ncbi:MAG: transporter substrate-binding domain-containing protein [Pseudomonadota bacterium]
MKLTPLNLLVLSLAVAPGPASAGEGEPSRLIVFTEDAAPHSVSKDGQVVGASTEFVRMMVEKAGFKPDVRMMSWKAVLQVAETQPAALIYPISRTSEREASYAWIGRLANYKTYLYKLKARTDIALKKTDDAKAYKIAAIREDVREEFLLAHGFRQQGIVGVTDNKEAMRLLMIGRVDLAPLSQVGLEGTCVAEKMNCSLFEQELPLGLTMDVYVAANKNTPADTVRRLQNAYDGLVADGSYQRLLGKFQQ